MSFEHVTILRGPDGARVEIRTTSNGSSLTVRGVVILDAGGAGRGRAWVSGRAQLAKLRDAITEHLALTEGVVRKRKRKAQP